MKVLIAVYKRSGAPIIRRVLGLCSADEVHVYGVRERSSVPSAEDSAVSNHNARVICVVDAESTNPDVARGIQENLWFLISFPPFVTMHMVLPELTAVLFHSPEHLSAILGLDVTPEDRIRAEYVPGEILDALIARSPRVHSVEELAEQIGDEYASRMREHPLMREIACSLEHALAAPPVQDVMDQLTGAALLPS
jgi:hypothetical protein